MEIHHRHRPGFFAFLFKGYGWKNKGYRVFHCKTCNKSIVMIPRHRTVCTILVAIGWLSNLIFLIVQRRLAFGRAMIIAGAVLLLWLLGFALAYRFAAFEPAEEEQGRQKHRK